MDGDSVTVNRPLLRKSGGMSASASASASPSVCVVLVFLLVASVKIPSAWQMASILFTAPDPDNFLCAGHAALAHEPWFNPCRSYMDENGTVTNTSTAFCRNFEFIQSYDTVVTQWGLVCGLGILVAVSQFFYLLGVLVGGVVCSALLQCCSARRLLLAALMMQLLAGVGVALAPYFALHVAMRFLTAAACTHMFSSGYVICTNMTEGKLKTVAASCYEHLWSVGVITLPCISQMFSDWRYFQLAITLPTFFILLCFRWIPDYTTWTPTVAPKIEACKNKDTTEGSEKVMNTEMNPLAKLSIHIAWICTVVTYYGGLLNVKNLGGDLYLNTALAGLAEISGCLIGLILLLWSPNKWLSLGIFKIVGGICCLVSWTLPKDLYNWHGLLLAFAMGGRIAIAASLTVLTIASNELFPPAIVKTTLFTCVTFARVFLMSAPFIGTLAIYGKCVPLSIFGSLTMLGGLCLVNQQPIDKLIDGNVCEKNISLKSFSTAAPSDENVKGNSEADLELQRPQHM